MRLSQGVLFVLCLSFPSSRVFAQVSAAAPVGPPRAILPSDVKIVRLDSATGSKLRIDGGSLLQLRVIVKEGDTAKEILRRQSIEPDGRALSVFYSLNKGITNADVLQTGSTVNLISTLQNLTEKQSLTFAFESTDRTQLVSLGALSANFRNDGWLAAKINDTGNAGSLAKLLQNATEKLALFADASIPLPQESLEQVVRAGTVAQGIALHMRQGAIPADSDVKVMNEIVEDMQLKLQAVQGGNNLLVPVEVRTHNVNPKLDDYLNLRVVAAAPIGMQNHALPTLSSPAKGSLSAGVFKFWVVRAGSGTVSDSTRILVQSQANGKPFLIDLIVLR